MFIGASSGSTGGGIKTTTFALFLAYLRSIFNGKTPSIFKRSIKDSLIKKALLIFILSFAIFLLGYFLIYLIEGDTAYVLNGERIFHEAEGASSFSSIDYSFEAMSAFATVGLSTGFTPYFKGASQFILIVLMYIGRVGPLTFAASFKPKKECLYRYVSEDVSIG